MAASTHHPHDCDNCGALLQGAFCHHCGQGAHNPVRSFAHAVEEVFESFWHLDGRIFRTLRDLLVPGKVATAYLTGKRVPYVAPMRLFLVLSLLTFFVARLAVHVEDPVPAAHGATSAQVLSKRGTDDFDKAVTPAEVEALRKRLVDELTRTRDGFPTGMNMARAGINVNIRSVQQQADQRLAELESPAAEDPRGMSESPLFSLRGRPWDPQANALQVAWLPGFANRWLNVQMGHLQDNLPRLSKHPQLLVNAFFAAVPSVLFVLVPLFALMLRLFYFRSGRVYLEHLVIAIYSHAFLCLDLLAILLLSLLEQALSGIAPWTSWPISALQLLLLLWMPIYLLLMQRCAYGQSWLATTLKYTLLGWIYSGIVFCAAVGLMLASFVRM
jgi:hypothetical protein